MSSFNDLSRETAYSSPLAPSAAGAIPSDGPVLRKLIDAIAMADAEDGLVPQLGAAQWEVFSPYLQPHSMEAGEVLFKAGAHDSTLYFVETGSLSIHTIDSADRVRLALVQAGSVVGEASFFTRLPRKATVQANSKVRLWALTPVRFAELRHRVPELALAVALAAGSVLGRRLANRRRRVAAT